MKPFSSEKNIGFEARSELGRCLDQQNNLTVVIYDYGRGLDRIDARKRGSPTNHLLTLVYRLDSKTRSFSEVSSK